MSPNLVLLVVAAVIIAAGVYLMMERSLTRILVGVLMASNGVNIAFIVASGASGLAPINGTNPAETISIGIKSAQRNPMIDCLYLILMSRHVSMNRSSL